MKEWNIGDRVKVIGKDLISNERKCKCTNGNPTLWSSGKMRLCGATGEVVDKLRSEGFDCYVYRLRFDGAERPSTSQFCGDDLENLPGQEAQNGFRFSVQIIGENVVVARMHDGDAQLGVGHAHVFHGGALGIMQAASFAMKRCYESMGGTFPQKKAIADFHVRRA